ncbi:MAG: complex I subunit 4 family protein [Candidatus Odinarchaeia archaeon]
MQLPTPVDSNWLLISLLILVIGSPIVYLVGRKYEVGSSWLAIIIAGIATVLFTVTAGWGALTGQAIYEEYQWGSGLFTMEFGLYADGLSTPVTAIVMIMATLATIYSVPYLKEETNKGAYFALMLLYIAGMAGVVLSTNLIQFFIFWELMLIPSWAMIVRWGTPGRASRAGLKYFLFTQFGSICILIGIAVTWVITAGAGTPTLNIYEIVIPGISFFATLAVPMFLLGFCVKMAIFPIHTWLPDAHGEAPTPVSAILSGVMIETAAYAIIRIAIGLYGPVFTDLVLFTIGGWVINVSVLIMIFAVITMLYGGIMALAQTDTKRLFAFSSVSQMGYILFGIGAVTALGLTGASFHIVTHAFGKATLFMVAGVLMTQVGHTKGRDINQLGGLAQQMPITTILALIAGLSIAGTPPLAGFASEWLIFAGAAEGGHIILLIFAVASTAITAGYILWFIRRVFFGPKKESLKDVKEAPWSMLIPMALLVFGAVIIGIFPYIVLDNLIPVIQNIAPLL